MSELTITPPAAAPNGRPGEPPPWGFWATAAWGAGAAGVFLLTQFVALFAIVLWWGIDPTHPTEELRDLTSNAIVLGSTTLACVPTTTLMIALAVHLRRIRFVDYLALMPIGVRTLVFAIVCTLAYGAVNDLLVYLAGRPMLSPFVTELYRTGRESGTLWLVLLAVMVAAPLTEEIFFRGFLFRGWAASRLGVAGTIVLTALIWAGIHVQYDWLGVAEIFGLGLLFGWLRYVSGSLLTTLVTHGLYGLAAIVQVAILTA